MLLNAIVIWSLLSIIIVAVLCRLVHNAKVADRALKIAKRDHPPQRRMPDNVSMTWDNSGDDDSHRPGG
jgi:type II secretory pathway pseudopilin PulG